jgi:hypothetical protein
MLVSARIKMAVVGLVVAGGGAAAALLGPAGPAVGQASQPVQAQIQVNSPGTLVAKGAGVNVSVTTNCSGPSGTTAGISLNLTERVGSEVAVGVGSTTVGCTGTNQTSLVLVTQTFGGFPSVTAGKAFKRGTAIAQASISACSADFSSCVTQQVAPTIAIQ